MAIGTISKDYNPFNGRTADVCITGKQHRLTVEAIIDNIDKRTDDSIKVRFGMSPTTVDTVTEEELYDPSICIAMKIGVAYTALDGTSMKAHTSEQCEYLTLDQCYRLLIKNGFLPAAENFTVPRNRTK